MAEERRKRVNMSSFMKNPYTQPKTKLTGFWLTQAEEEKAAPAPETHASTVVGILMELLGEAIQQRFPAPQATVNKTATSGFATAKDTYQFKLSAVLDVLREANPEAARQHAPAASREQLFALLKQNRVQGESKRITQILVRHFNVLATQTHVTSHGMIRQISAQTLGRIAMMSGQAGQITYEGLLTYRALAAVNSISVEDVSAVMQKISGRGWQRSITRELLKTFALQPDLLWADRNIAMVLLNHFEKFSHYDSSENIDLIDLSDIQAVARHSDPERATIITREGVTWVVLDTEERKQIERWLDRNNLDENGCKLTDNTPPEVALMGYFDRYDRILSCYPQRPWYKG